MASNSFVVIIFVYSSILSPANNYLIPDKWFFKLLWQKEGYDINIKWNVILKIMVKIGWLIGTLMMYLWT